MIACRQLTGRCSTYYKGISSHSLHNFMFLLMLLVSLTNFQGTLLARYLAKGNPLAEVADLKERLRGSEDALRLERQRYTTLRREHDEPLKSATDLENEQDKKIERLAKSLQNAEATINTQKGALEMATKCMMETEAVSAKNWDLMRLYLDNMLERFNNFASA